MKQPPDAVSIIRRMILIFLFFLSAPFNSFSQPANETTDNKIRHLLEYARQYDPINDKLINGYLYNLPDKRIDGHPYLDQDLWVLGTLFISGDIYDQELLKYDLTRDDLILKARMIKGNFKAIELTHEHVDSFSLDNRLFVNSRKFKGLDEDMVYYEQILDDQLIFLRKHAKHFISQYDVLTPHGKFSNQETRNYFLDKGTLINVTGRRAFINFFSKPKRKEIKNFLRRENIRYRKASDAELRRLLDYCNQIISQ